MRQAIIIDVDNVLMDSRVPDLTQPNVRTDREAWRKWQPEMRKCEKITEMWDLISAYYEVVRPAIFLLTSRESTDELLEITLNQLDKLMDGCNCALLMRAEDDNRTSPEVKRSLYESVIKGRFNVLFAIDDLEENINMWKSLGIKTLQFRYGDWE